MINTGAVKHILYKYSENKWKKKTCAVIPTEKKPKGPISKLFKGKSKGFTLPAEVRGMVYYYIQN